VSIFDEGDDWFELSEDLWRDPRTVPRKLRLCADASVPAPFVEELRSAKIATLYAPEEGLSSRPDDQILAWARRSGGVLLTFDRDFWDDRKFPLQAVRGVIFVDVPAALFASALGAFMLVYEAFAKTYSLDRWQSMKVRATTRGFVLKMRSYEGREAAWAIKAERGRVLARELR
jgi:hypothetical protein